VKGNYRESSRSDIAIMFKSFYGNRTRSYTALALVFCSTGIVTKGLVLRNVLSGKWMLRFRYVRCWLVRSDVGWFAVKVEQKTKMIRMQQCEVRRRLAAPIMSQQAQYICATYTSAEKRNEYKQKHSVRTIGRRIDMLGDEL
jgi:hypothetical protein